jgi:hypothetical protein
LQNEVIWNQTVDIEVKKCIYTIEFDEPELYLSFVALTTPLPYTLETTFVTFANDICNNVPFTFEYSALTVPFTLTLAPDGRVTQVIADDEILDHVGVYEITLTATFQDVTATHTFTLEVIHPCLVTFMALPTYDTVNIDGIST